MLLCWDCCSQTWTLASVTFSVINLVYTFIYSSNQQIIALWIINKLMGQVTLNLLEPLLQYSFFWEVWLCYWNRTHVPKEKPNILFPNFFLLHCMNRFVKGVCCGSCTLYFVVWVAHLYPYPYFPPMYYTTTTSLILWPTAQVKTSCDDKTWVYNLHTWPWNLCLC